MLIASAIPGATRNQGTLTHRIHQNPNIFDMNRRLASLQFNRFPDSSLLSIADRHHEQKQLRTERLCLASVSDCGPSLREITAGTMEDPSYLAAFLDCLLTW